MIHYNMRYRGPYEYEKFVLNTLQYSNLMNDFSNDATQIDTWKTLKELQVEVDKMFEESIGPHGRSEEIYRKFIMLKEAR